MGRAAPLIPRGVRAPHAQLRRREGREESRPQSQQLARASLVHLVSAVHPPARPLAQNRWLASEADFTRANQEPHKRFVVYFVRTVVVHWFGSGVFPPAPSSARAERVGPPRNPAVAPRAIACCSVCLTTSCSWCTKLYDARRLRAACGVASACGKQQWPAAGLRYLQHPLAILNP